MMSDYSVETQISRINPNQPDPQIIAQAAKVLRELGLVAFPTETVYGLGANALDETAVGRIFAAKQRPFYDPLIVHIAHKKEIDFVAQAIPDIAYTLAKKFWPGPLTLVLKRHERVAPNVSAGLGTVAVRMPNHRIPLDLIEAAGVPVAAPSANLFTRPSPTSAQHVLDDLGGHVDIILDGGPCPIGLESTVLDLTSDQPTILRPGGTPAEALKEIIIDLILPESQSMKDDQTSKPSPGMMLKHYSPKARFLLFKGGRENAVDQIKEIAQNLISQGYKIGLMVTDEDYPQFSGFQADIERLGSRDDLSGIGQILFARMRSLDKKGVGYILMRSLPSEGLGLAIGDRLFKAAEQRVIDLDSIKDISDISRFL
jgi:L-threonylcarbamoyladenylate synthase